MIEENYVPSKTKGHYNYLSHTLLCNSGIKLMYVQQSKLYSASHDVDTNVKYLL